MKTVKSHLMPLILTVSCAGCPIEKTDVGPGGTGVVSRAYQGHETDLDMNNLVQVYPYLAGT